MGKTFKFCTYCEEIGDCCTNIRSIRHTMDRELFEILLDLDTDEMRNLTLQLFGLKIIDNWTDLFVMKLGNDPDDDRVYIVETRRVNSFPIFSCWKYHPAYCKSCFWIKKLPWFAEKEKVHYPDKPRKSLPKVKGMRKQYQRWMQKEFELICTNTGV
ncbi:MAG: hypothetical protein INQ03_24020 [Candidatus Heimdallarchaeota archaeon]|nr:hypothetical protein [Candidatus Heimdallarchaeota archaeon]